MDDERAGRTDAAGGGGRGIGPTAGDSGTVHPSESLRIDVLLYHGRTTTVARGPGDYGLVGNRWSNTLDTYNMALILQIPIFDGAQREGRIAQARSQWQQESLRMRSVLNQVKMEVQDALASLTAAQEQVNIAQTGLQMATKELNLARERYTVLTSTSHFELTNGLSSVARARENLVTALFQLNAARVNLARSMGSLHALN